MYECTEKCNEQCHLKKKLVLVIREMKHELRCSTKDLSIKDSRRENLFKMALLKTRQNKYTTH